MKIDEARRVLKVRIALICSLALNHIAPTLNCALSTSLAKRGLRRALKWLWKVLSISGMSRGHGMGIYTHPT
jgi:hypothetical protein